MSRAAGTVALIIFFAGCTTAAVDVTEPRRLVGTEDGVRVVAEVGGEELRPGNPIPITYEVANERPTTIAIADMVSVTSFDPDAYVFTVDIGSEVPGELLVPRLIAIAPGEKKTFVTTARVAFLPPRTNTIAPAPRPSLRLKVNFLGGDISRFTQLMEMTEKAVADRELADELFHAWVERNEVIYTNAIPMGRPSNAGRDATPAPVQRRAPGRAPF